MCVCVCVCVRARVCVCVCVYMCRHGHGSMMAIFDATNTTRERRRRVLERAMKGTQRLKSALFRLLYTIL